jgi:serine/threonine protein kinase
MSMPTPSHASHEAPLGRGASIGRYVVLGLVGRGGMGEVYAAYDPELDRKVAVKLLRAKAGNGVTITEGRQRTLREAQAIARLSHPNVVVVYDVGTFEDKIFIAMEFVDGNTVTFWLEQEPRSWRDILKVFLAAGRGLEAAHEKDLIHRDFKPDNVMVARNGDVRVMDFGLARQMPAKGAAPRPRRPQPMADTRGEVGIDEGTLVLNAVGSDGGGDLRTSSVSGLFDARLTRTGAMMGTPAYMAPEQFFGTETNARTDQFSFCVSLYEALYGERPFAGKNLTELTANVVQGTIRSAPPNSKVPFWLRRILLRGLRSAAAERYPTMHDLLTALAYDPRAHRRKLLFAAAALTVPLALGFGIRQKIIERRALCGGGEDKLAGVWDLHAPDKPDSPRQSEIHAAFLRTGKGYAADVWETVSRALTKYAERWSGMYKDACEATQRRHEQSEEVLDLRMSCLQERLNGIRALTDVFANASGEVVENAVSATNQLATLDRCADVPTLRLVVKPPDDVATVARVAYLRERLAATKARFDAGRWKETLKDAPALVSQTRALGYQPLIAESLGLIGRMYVSANDSRSAEKTFAEAYRLADASRHDELRAQVAADLVFVTGYQERRFEDAQRWSEEASSILERLGGHELLRAWLLNDLGCAYFASHNNDAGAKVLKEALALKESLLGVDDPDVGLSSGNLGYVLEKMGRHEEALRFVERAIDIGERKLGSQHPRLAMYLDNLGVILNALGRSGEARRAFEQAISIWERELGPDDVTLGAALTGIGSSYLIEGKPASAIKPLERALKVRVSQEIDPGDKATTCFDLARALWESGQDRQRAQRLADSARLAYGEAHMQTEAIAVSDWLRDHSSS